MCQNTGGPKGQNGGCHLASLESEVKRIFTKPRQSRTPIRIAPRQPLHVHIQGVLQHMDRSLQAQLTLCFCLHHVCVLLFGKRDTSFDPTGKLLVSLLPTLCGMCISNIYIYIYTYIYGCQNQWYHFGVGAPPISAYFSG